MPDAPHPLTRTAVLFARFADATQDRLLRRYRGVDPDSVASAVTDAVIEASADPGTDPDAAEFPRWLAGKAKNKLRITLRGDKRRRDREEKYARTVTDHRPAALSPSEALTTDELVAGVQARLAPTPRERAALDLWLGGVTDPTDLAARVGGTRADAVRTLARLRKRIERERARHAGHTSDEPIR